MTHVKDNNDIHIYKDTLFGFNDNDNLCFFSEYRNKIKKHLIYQ